MNKLKTFFGWLFLTKAYLATLSDEQIAIRAGLRRAGMRRGRYGYKREATRRVVAAIDASWRAFVKGLS